ncbi:MAG TPA: alkaline phosphatase D family protein [Casimicrobiaceae bacterium]|nr:alkaline phosphatase D family protein [Casimicrobiaceae bacterium]
MRETIPDDPRRRGFLALALAAGVAPGLLACAHRDRAAGDPFALGVASGCPRPDSVVLWTRLAPQSSPAPSQSIAWELADDERFSRVLRSGSVVVDASTAHSLHVTVEGLAPSRWYWYRFSSAGARSETGRTRTAPPPDREEPFAFAIASCQRFDDGHYAAWRHMADESPDLVVFLGDYIYESAPRGGRVRTHVGEGAATTLADYRARYEQYRSDPALRRIHATAPWIVTWDDHEVQNDYASDRGPDLAPHFLARRAAAYRAWWEHMPLPMSMRPIDANLRVYDRYAWGALARFHVLDDRQYRDYQACPQPGRGGSNTVNDGDCPDLVLPKRSILGPAQEAWLSDGLAQAGARWNLVAQQTLVAPFTWSKAGRHWTDGWSGYPAARERLMDAIVERRVQDVVALSGDVHCNYVADLRRRPDDPPEATIATEFCGTSISSAGLPQARVDAALAFNPHIRYARSDERGYVSLAVSRARVDARLRVVSDVGDPQATIRTAAAFAVEAGRPGAQPA